MIKGIVALFTSGIIFNPMVLLGVILGILGALKASDEQLKAIFAEPLFYTMVLFVSALYVLIMAKVYKDGGIEIDWPATIFKIIGGCVKFLMAFVLAIAFVFMIAF